MRGTSGEKHGSPRLEGRPDPNALPNDENVGSRVVRRYGEGAGHEVDLGAASALMFGDQFDCVSGPSAATKARTPEDTITLPAPNFKQNYPEVIRRRPTQPLSAAYQESRSLALAVYLFGGQST